MCHCGVYRGSCWPKQDKSQPSAGEQLGLLAPSGPAELRRSQFCEHLGLLERVGQLFNNAQGPFDSLVGLDPASVGCSL
jgi:hypothetical protein